MNELYPVIRRKRRPLIVADVPPVVATHVEPVPAVATTPAEPLVADSHPDAGHDEPTPTAES
jgi:hypothetical protein